MLQEAPVEGEQGLAVGTKDEFYLVREDEESVWPGLEDVSSGLEEPAEE